MLLIYNLMQKIHISTLRAILKAGDPVDLDVWTKSGEIIHLNAVEKHRIIVKK